jgi:hypothetical protein
MSLVLEEVTTLKTVQFHQLPIITEDYPLWELLHTFQVGSMKACFYAKCSSADEGNSLQGRPFTVRISCTTSGFPRIAY